MSKKFLVMSLAIAAIISFTFALPNINSPAFSADVIKLKFANYFPPPAPHSKICEDFIAEVEKRSGGRVKIQYFAGGSLLKAPRMYEGVVTGIADIGLAHVEYTPGRFPVTEVCDLPLGYPSGWVSNQVVNDFYHYFQPKEWDKVHILWMHASNPNVVISKKPVRVLADMKGLTIRAPGRVGNTIKALGATPAPTPIMEVYDGIAKGVLDGVNTPYETLRTFRFAEVAKHVTTSWQVGNLYTFYVAMNKDRYNALPPDIRQIFDELSGVYRERMALMWNSIDFAGKNFAAEKGVEFIDLTSAEVDVWKKATAPVVEDYVKKMVASGNSEADVRSWLTYLDERIKYWTAKQVSLFIKSPTGPPEMRP